MKKLVKSFKEKFREAIAHKDFKSVFLFLLGLLALGATAALVVLLVVLSLAELLDVISENLAYVAGAIILCIWGTVYIREKQKEQQAQFAEQRSREVIETNLVEQTIGECNYETIKQILFTVLNSVAKNCNLEPPSDLSSLDAPRHFIKRNGTIIYCFEVLKQGDVNISRAISLMENRMRQLTLSHELGLEPTTFIHSSGRAFPILIIDSAIDTGAFIALQIAWASEEYCTQWLERRFYTPKPPICGGNDDDF